MSQLFGAEPSRWREPSQIYQRRGEKNGKKDISYHARLTTSQLSVALVKNTKERVAIYWYNSVPRDVTSWNVSLQMTSGWMTSFGSTEK